MGLKNEVEMLIRTHMGVKTRNANAEVRADIVG